ncbi:MAG: ribonuclease III [Oscillospiraceae bacterium]|jgi:ribonuclease-3 family protein|nr:ribonuclease III [Oscillospiraceae bacterium]
MNPLFETQISDEKIRDLSSLGLAHIGDAVYELLARTRVCAEGRTTHGGLHKATVALVAASAQFEAAKRVLPRLTDAERDVYNRGRNSHVSKPRGASFEEYHAATALESLFGWLYLKGETARVLELFAVCMGDE